MQDDAIYSLATLIPTEFSAYSELRVEYDGFDGETKLTLEGEGMKFYFSNGRPLGGVITSHSRTKFNFGTTEFSSLPIAKDLLYDRIGEPQSWRRERSSHP